MSWKREKLRILLSFTAIVTAIMMIGGLSVSVFIGHAGICALIALGVGAAYFVIMYLMTIHISEDPHTTTTTAEDIRNGES